MAESGIDPVKWLALTPNLWVLYRDSTPIVSLSKWPQGWILGRRTHSRPCILFETIAEAAHFAVKGK